MIHPQKECANFCNFSSMSTGANFTITSQQRVFSKVAKGIWTPNITFSTCFEGMCTLLDILYACTHTHTFDLHLSEEILCFWWVKIQVLHMIVLQQLSEAGEWGAFPRDQTDRVLTHAHVPVRWYSSIFYMTTISCYILLAHLLYWHSSLSWHYMCSTVAAGSNKQWLLDKI
jgi:hypothetical protein